MFDLLESIPRSYRKEKPLCAELVGIGSDTGFEVAWLAAWFAMRAFICFFILKAESSVAIAFLVRRWINAAIGAMNECVERIFRQFGPQPRWS